MRAILEGEFYPECLSELKDDCTPEMRTLFIVCSVISFIMFALVGTLFIKAVSSGNKRQGKPLIKILTYFFLTLGLASRNLFFLDVAFNYSMTVYSLLEQLPLLFAALTIALNNAFWYNIYKGLSEEKDEFERRQRGYNRRVIIAMAVLVPVYVGLQLYGFTNDNYMNIANFVMFFVLGISVIILGVMLLNKLKVTYPDLYTGVHWKISVSYIYAASALIFRGAFDLVFCTTINKHVVSWQIYSLENNTFLWPFLIIFLLVFCELIPVTAILVAIYVGEKKVSRNMIKVEGTIPKLIDADTGATKTPAGRRYSAIVAVGSDYESFTSNNQSNVSSLVDQEEGRKDPLLSGKKASKNSHLFWVMESITK